MKHRYGLVSACLSAALLAACGGSNSSHSSLVPAIENDAQSHRAAGVSYKSLYSFKGYPYDGEYPVTGLIDVGGTLYGTTGAGGAGGTSGTVFKVSTSGQESELYSFKGGGDGAGPSGLIDVGGTLYGTTNSAGTGCGRDGCGTVFKVSTSGTESALYKFKGGRDGATPQAGLIDVDGTLYGTTSSGGAHHNGTVFKVSTSGTESVLYSFKGGSDGSDPIAGLVDVGGTLYGTTYTGGKEQSICSNGCGTVFKVSTSGEESVLHSFGSGTDGKRPAAGLIGVGGTLYGTTLVGGTGKCYFPGGCGTVFKVSTSGKESVLYSFKNYPDGFYPYAGLKDVAGTLYGTASDYSGGDTRGCGVVFKVSTSGKENVLYGFKLHPDGCYPYAGLIAVEGTLYGTTFEGGRGTVGTVFKLTP